MITYCQIPRMTIFLSPPQSARGMGGVGVGVDEGVGGTSRSPLAHIFQTPHGRAVIRVASLCDVSRHSREQQVSHVCDRLLRFICL